MILGNCSEQAIKHNIYTKLSGTITAPSYPTQQEGWGGKIGHSL